MAASWPGSIKSWTDKQDNVDDVMAADVNGAYAEIIALETELNLVGYKKSVRCATTQNGTLASAFADGQTVDGITLATGDRILIKNQTTGSENGIYTVNAAGAPTRAVDMDADAEAVSGLMVYIREGTANAKKKFVLTNTGAITIGTTALTFETDANVSADSGDYLDLPALYGSNVKPIALFQSTESWGNFVGTGGADTTNVKIGSQSLKLTENDNTAGGLSGDLVVADNLAIFQDGSASITDDYIRVTFYISDVTKVDTAAGKGISLNFGTAGWATCYSYHITSELVTGLNTFNIAKSVFSVISGSPNWNNITLLQVVWYSLANSINAYVSFQLIDMVRKDPSAASPNVLQYKNNNVWTRQYAINSGFWFLGLEFGRLVLRDIKSTPDSDSAILGIKSYVDCIMQSQVLLKSTDQFYGLCFYIDASNYIRVYGASNTLYLRSRIGGANTDTTLACTYTSGNRFEITFIKKGSTVDVVLYKNGDRSTPYSLTAEFAVATAGYLAMGTMSGRYYNIESLSITTLEHVHHADVAEVAMSLVNVPACRVYNSANQSIDTGTVTKLAFNSERFDNNGMHDNVTNNTRITCNTAGKYLMAANVSWDANATGERIVQIKLNNTTVLVASRIAGKATDPTDQNIVTVYDLAVTDYVEVLVYQNSGGALNSVVNANWSPEFMMIKVG